MNRYKQAPTLVKIRTILVIILSAFLASVAIEIILAERTNALLQETLQGTTSLVKKVISPVAPSNPAVSPPVASPAKSKPSNPQTANTPPTTSNPSASSTSDSSSATQPITPISVDLKEIYFSKSGLSDASINAQFASAKHGVVAPSSFGLLQATEQGWKLLGLLWYWWLAGMASIVVSVIVWRRQLQQSLVSKLLYTQHKLYAE